MHAHMHGVEAAWQRPPACMQDVASARRGQYNSELHAERYNTTTFVGSTSLPNLPPPPECTPELHASILSRLQPRTIDDVPPPVARPIQHPDLERRCMQPGGDDTGSSCCSQVIMLLQQDECCTKTHLIVQHALHSANQHDQDTQLRIYAEVESWTLAHYLSAIATLILTKANCYFYCFFSSVASY